MSEQAAVLELELRRGKPRVLHYIALTKPRIVTMVLATTLAGFYLGSMGGWDLRMVVHLIVGTALAAGGTLTLNQYLERDLDACMARTRSRPLPAGNLTPPEALWFGAILTSFGCGYLYFTVSPLNALLTAAIPAIYLAVYTPMKRYSALCSIVGAVPGALPPVAGWAAARGQIDLSAVVLFAIMFLWQLPHSLAIAEIYCEDYRRAGIHLLPLEDPDGKATNRQIASNSVALLGVGLLPTLLGVSGRLYFAAALALGGLMVWTAFKLLRHPGKAGARRVMYASLVYLPAIFLVMVLDKL